MARRAMTDLAWQRRGRAGSGRAPTESRAIRGRERELQAVSELVRGAAKGRDGTRLIDGELGAEKQLHLSRAPDAAREDEAYLADTPRVPRGGRSRSGPAADDPRG